MRIFLIMILFTLSACKPKQLATEFNDTVNPLSGIARYYETPKNTPLEVSYSMNQVSPKERFEIVKRPSKGYLSNCHIHNMEVNCTYTPRKDYVGNDTLELRTVDGSFKSSETTKLFIIVNDSNDNIIDDLNDATENCVTALANGTTTNLSEVINFPETQGCAWDENDNLGKLDGNIMARREQFVTHSLPAGSTICEIDFDFSIETDEMKYDDEILLTLNNYVMLSSMDMSDSDQMFPHHNGTIGYTNGLAFNELGLLVYNWMGDFSIRSQKYSHQLSSARGNYCLGLSQSDDGFEDNCYIPFTQTSGEIIYNMPSSSAIKLGVASSKLQDESVIPLEFGFITAGDNDINDCEHKEYEYQVNIKYILPPSTP